MRRLPIVTGRLAAVAAAAVLVVAVTGGWTTFVVVNAALGVLALGDGLAAVAVRRLSVERELPEVMSLHDDGELAWRVRNPSGRTARLHLADDVPASLRAGDRRAALTVPARAAVRQTTTLRPDRRGRFELEGVTVRSFGPLGLAGRQRRVPVLGVVRVVPSFRSREEAELRARRARLLEEGLRSVRERGSGTDFDRLRDYVHGDEERHVDWAATARLGRLIVREFRIERNQTVVALLDTGRLMAGRVRRLDAGRSWARAGTPVSATTAEATSLPTLTGVVESAEHTLPRLDHAMDAVLALATVTSRLGDRTGLVAYADRVRAAVPATAGRAQLRRLTDAMYDLEPQLVESDLSAALRATFQRFRRRALLVICSELAPGAVEETLLPALPMAVRHHVVVVVAVRDPALDALAVAEPHDAVGAHRQAAAVDALARRQSLTVRLSAAGARVVDEPPGRVAGALTDAYLDIKLRARL